MQFWMQTKNLGLNFASLDLIGTSPDVSVFTLRLEFLLAFPSEGKNNVLIVLSPVLLPMLERLECE